MGEGKSSALTLLWCIVANILRERPYGLGRQELRSGTKHFASGAQEAKGKAQEIIAAMQEWHPTAGRIEPSTARASRREEQSAWI